MHDAAAATRRDLACRSWWHRIDGVAAVHVDAEQVQVEVAVDEPAVRADGRVVDEQTRCRGRSAASATMPPMSGAARSATTRRTSTPCSAATSAAVASSCSFPRAEQHDVAGRAGPPRARARHRCPSRRRRPTPTARTAQQRCRARSPTVTTGRCGPARMDYIYGLLGVHRPRHPVSRGRSLTGTASTSRTLARLRLHGWVAWCCDGDAGGGEPQVAGGEPDPLGQADMVVDQGSGGEGRR